MGFYMWLECLLRVLYAQNGLQMPQMVESTTIMHLRYHKNEIYFLLCWLEMIGRLVVSGSKVSKIQDRWIIYIWL